MGLKCTLPPHPTIAFIGDSITKGNTSFDGGHDGPVVVVAGRLLAVRTAMRTAFAPSTWACGARPCWRKRRPPAHARRRRTSTSCTAPTKSARGLADAVLIMLGTNDARVPTADVDAHFVEDYAAIVRAVVAAAAQLSRCIWALVPPATRGRMASALRVAALEARVRQAARLTRIGVIDVRAPLERDWRGSFGSTGRRRRATACTRRRLGCGGLPTRCGAAAAALRPGGGGSPSAVALQNLVNFSTTTLGSI